MPPANPNPAERKWTEPYKAVAQLATLRKWHNVDFTGSPINDFLAFESEINFIKEIQADTSHAGGVRVQFHRRATYVSLLEAIDVLNTLNQKRYWLDVKHQPLTLYAITDNLAVAPGQPILLQ